MDLSEALQQVLLALLSLGVSVVIYFIFQVRDQIIKKIGPDRFAVIAQLVPVVVSAVEKLGLTNAIADTAQGKLDEARVLLIALAAKAGVEIDEREARVYIEDAINKGLQKASQG